MDLVRGVQRNGSIAAGPLSPFAEAVSVGQKAGRALALSFPKVLGRDVCGAPVGPCSQGIWEGCVPCSSTRPTLWSLWGPCIPLPALLSALSVGTLFWIVCSEVLPAKVTAIGFSLINAAQCSFSLATTFLFPILDEVLGTKVPEHRLSVHHEGAWAWGCGGDGAEVSIRGRQTLSQKFLHFKSNPQQPLAEV